MVRRIVPVCLPLVLAAAGCFSEDPAAVLVPTNPFQAPANGQAPHLACAPSTQEAAGRVTALGQKVLAANPQLGLRPMFQTVGAPHAEIFHQGTEHVILTEGLVKQCATDNQLSAVLCAELGKMAADREAKAPTRSRAMRGEPMNVAVGNDYAGTAGPADRTDLAELSKLGLDSRRPAATPAVPPDPQALARSFLVKAGYSAQDLDAVKPVLQAAAENFTLEKQFNSTLPARP